MRKSAFTGIMACLFLFVALQSVPRGAFAQAEEKTKTGWTFGALPAISYNSDLGFQYGALVNFYYFGDGTTYPKYLHSLYGEVSRYTKGSGINRFFYDSEYLIPNIRVTADISYLTEKALDFYGFNGYDAVYNPDWEDDSQPPDIYRSRMFYRHERKMFRFMTDFQGKLMGNELRWVAGFGILNNATAPVDIDALNKGRKKDSIPNVPGLYDKYIEWGIIGDKEKEGGWSNNIKLGVVYDTRDFEPNPMKGMWSEVVVFTAPKFLGNGDFGYTKISATHRQYFTLVKEKLSFAYRLNYQGTIAGTVPFYMQPYMINSFSNTSNTDGLGGSKTVRGVLRNRVVGDAFAMGNAELRWKFFRTVVFNQNLYLGLNLFADAGQVLKKIDIDDKKFPPDSILKKEDFFEKDAESLHATLGLGFRIVLNENFIVAVDYGRPFDTRDGTGGLYIGLNYLF
jgi:outer membrane protein assembly factor BamA